VADKSFLSKIAGSPETKKLVGNMGDFVTARAGTVGKKVSEKVSEAPEGGPIDRMKKGGKRGAIAGGIKGAIKGLFKRGGKSKLPITIIEDVLLGVDADTAWETWTDYEQFPSYMKGAESVKPDDDDSGGEDSEDQKKTANWKGKVWLSHREWKSTIEEEIPGQRVRWKSEGSKGAIDGCVTFTPLGENLTQMLVVLEYRSKGFFEAIGRPWRMVGRRARLDIKHFRRHVMMQETEQRDESDEDAGDEEEQGQEQEQDQEQGDTNGGSEEPEDEDEDEEEQQPRRRRQPARSS
jgi:uncharacterized membrane protein